MAFRRVVDWGKPISEEQLKALVCGSTFGRECKLLNTNSHGWDIQSSTSSGSRVFIEAKGNKKRDGSLRSPGNCRDYVAIGLREVLVYAGKDTKARDVYCLAVPHSWKAAIFEDQFDGPFARSFGTLFENLVTELRVLFVANNGDIDDCRWGDW